jgi:hypothetical protein
VTVTRLAAVVTFTDANWYQQQTVVLRADPLFEVPLVREGVKEFPVSTHLLSKLRGPVAVEGGVTGADRSLTNGLKLPGERDGYLLAIGPQIPESQQIDVLNIFNDSSQQDLSGVMTATRLTGFGMADDLDLGGAGRFGEPDVVPGGISFGKINFGATGNATDSGQSTIEVVNLLLGEGNDRLVIEGTLDPAPAVSAENEFVFSSAAGTISRAGFDWRAQGFLVGQQITIDGLAGTWTVVAIDDATDDPNDNSILRLSGTVALPNETAIRRIIANDAPVFATAPVTVVGTPGGTPTGGTVTRTDSGRWDVDGFVAGHLVQLNGTGINGQWRLVALSEDGGTMTLGGAALPAYSGPLTVSLPGRHGGLTVVHGGGNSLLTTTAMTQVNGASLTRTDGLAWADDGFAIGQVVRIAGEAGTRIVLGFGNAARRRPGRSAAGAPAAYWCSMAMPLPSASSRAR